MREGKPMWVREGFDKSSAGLSNCHLAPTVPNDFSGLRQPGPFHGGNDLPHIPGLWDYDYSLRFDAVWKRRTP